MNDFCTSRGVPVLDLHERFATAPDPSKLYSAAVDDRQFSTAGQAVAAEAMVEFLAPLMSASFNEATQSYRAGLESMDRRRFAAAERALTDAARLRPRWSAPHVALGELHGQSGRLQKVAQHFNEAIARHPDSWRAREGFAEVCVAGGDLETAIQAYLQALKLRPAWYPYRERLQQLHQRRGEADVAATHGSAVERAFNASLLVRRLWWSEHYEAGAALAARRKWSEAERAFIRAAAFLPDDPVSHYNLGSLYERLSKTEKAAASYREALGMAPDFAPAKDRLSGLNAN